MTRFARKILLISVCAGVAWSGACSENVEQDSSATHFLSACAATCPGTLECTASSRICTIECSSSRDCASLSPRAACIEETPGSNMVQPNVCDVPCSAESDCSGVASAPHCTQGRCRPFTIEDASVPQTGGAGGTVGSGGQQAGGEAGAVSGGTGGVSGSGGAATGGTETGGARTDSGVVTESDGGVRGICGIPATAAPLPCHGTSTSNLPGTSTVLLPTKCSYTVAEATQGVSLPFVVAATDDVSQVLAKPLDVGGCSQPDTSGFETFVDVSGGTQHYCECDIGLCHDPIALPFDLKAGCRSGSVVWSGVNWSGPSDTNMPKGAPFPPGDYVVRVRQAGTFLQDGGNSAFQLEATINVTITQ